MVKNTKEMAWVETRPEEWYEILDRPHDFTLSIPFPFPLRRHPNTVEVLRRDIDEPILMCLVANEPFLSAPVTAQDPLQYLPPRNSGNSRVRDIKGSAVSEIVAPLPGGCLGGEIRVVEVALDSVSTGSINQVDRRMGNRHWDKQHQLDLPGYKTQAS
jgi:hypothetical protein